MSLALDDQLCFAMYAASRAMTAAYGPLLEALDLTYPQYLVMMVLWDHDGDRVSKIGERLHLDSATLTPLLKRLEARDLIVRKRSREDERVVQVFVSARGKRLHKKAADVPRCMLAKTGLTLAELGALRGELHALTERLRAADAA